VAKNHSIPPNCRNSAAIKSHWNWGFPIHFPTLKWWCPIWGPCVPGSHGCPAWSGAHQSCHRCSLAKKSEMRNGCPDRIWTVKQQQVMGGFHQNADSNIVKHGDMVGTRGSWWAFVNAEAHVLCIL
jgi:hypothetical protein